MQVLFKVTEVLEVEDAPLLMENEVIEGNATSHTLNLTSTVSTGVLDPYLNNFTLKLRIICAQNFLGRAVLAGTVVVVVVEMIKLST